jgi:hypothetical protein
MRTARNVRRVVVIVFLGLLVFGVYRFSGLSSPDPNATSDIVYVDTGINARSPQKPNP